MTVKKPTKKSAKKPVDYKKEYKKYHSSAKAKLDRASRNRVRGAAVKAGKIKKGDISKEVDHIDGNPRNNSPKNLRVISRAKNRKKQ